VSLAEAAEIAEVREKEDRRQERESCAFPARRLGGRMSELNALTGQIIGAAIEVHRVLGPGLLESVYQMCMEAELRLRQVSFVSQVPVAVAYKEQAMLPDGFRMDLLVDEAVVVELKSVEDVREVHKKQLLTYLKLTGKRVGLLINFNVPVLREGITRIVNEYEPDAG